MSDGRVLHALAEELDVDLALPTRRGGACRAAALGAATSAVPRCRSERLAGRPPTPGAGEALLATWHELLDAGRMQDGDEYLAGTAKPALRPDQRRRPLPSSASADGSRVAVGTDRGAVVAARRDRPSCPTGWCGCRRNARDCAVRATLGAVHGSVVRIGSDAPPVVGLSGGAR